MNMVPVYGHAALDVDLAAAGFAKVTISSAVFSSSDWRKMENYGVFASLGSAEAERSVEGDMTSLEFRCESATGYFLDDEGLEAPIENLEDFLNQVLPDGGILSIEGHYDAFGGRRIRNEASYMKADGAILRECRRESICLETGVVDVIAELTEITEHRVKIAAATNVVSLIDYRKRRHA